MPTDWGPVLQTGIGAAAAVGGGLLGAWMQGRSQAQRTQQEQCERAAAVISAALSVHVKTSPSAIDTQPDFSKLAEQFRNLKERYDAITTELWMLSVWYPSKTVRVLANQAVPAMQDGIASAFDYACLRLEPQREGEDRPKVAQLTHDIAGNVLVQLTKAVRRR